MKGKEVSKRNEGITLIALVITIIVLLILAGVTIATLTGDNGLLTKAGNTKNTANEAEIEEKLKLAYQDYYLGQHTEAGYTFQNALDKMFGEGVAIATGNDIDGYTVKYNAKDYFISSTGSIQKLAKWNDNGDGTWTHSETGEKIKIGDIVNYNEGTGYTYTTDTTRGIGGSLGTMDSTTKKYPLNSKTYTTEDLSWRVLGINENGQVELISENPMSDENKIYLTGEEAYLYGVDELNTMCNNLYGKGSGAFNARSLKAEDIDKLAGIKTDSDKKALNSQYGDICQYRYPTSRELSGTRYLQLKINDNSWSSITDNNAQKFIYPGERTIGKINDSEIITGYSPEFIVSNYYYRISQKITQTTTDGISISRLLHSGTGKSYIKQALANKSISGPNLWTSNKSISYNIGAIYDQDVIGFGVCRSDSAYYVDEPLRVRPVVTLKSDVKLSGSSSEGWTLQQ